MVAFPLVLAKRGDMGGWKETWLTARSYGVMVSTLDSESSDPSSNLGRTSHSFKQSMLVFYFQCKDGHMRGRGRDSSVGRALD